MLRPVEIAVLLAFLVPAAGLVGFLAWHMGARRTFKRRMREVPVRAISELKEGETARVVGAVVCAGGMAIVGVLALRAMGEWREFADREQAGHAPR